MVAATMLENMQRLKHKSAVVERKSTRSLSSQWSTAKPSADGDRTVAAKVYFTGFLVEHNLPITTADHAGKLLQKMFLDSKIAASYHCGRTKTTHIINGAIAPECLNVVKSKLSEDPCFCLATGASSDESNKCLPILIRHVDGLTGLIRTSLLDMPDITAGDTSTLFNTCEVTLVEAGLKWEHRMAYSSDNASAMVSRHNSLLPQIKQKQKDEGYRQLVLGFGCPCHLCHLWVQKGANTLSVKVEDIIIDLYYHYEKRGKRKAELCSSTQFTDSEVRKVLKHVSTRWLSLGKTVARTIEQWEGLRSYFLSDFGHDREKGGEREKRLVKAFNDP